MALPMSLSVEIKLSGLNFGIPEEKIRMFFEERGENIRISSYKRMDDSSAVVNLLGITSEELEELLTAKHRICKAAIKLEVLSSSKERLPCNHTSCVTINITANSVLDKEELELYFDTPKSGGHKESVKSCVIGPNGAQIEFISPEVAADVMAIKKHVLFGLALKLQYACCEPSISEHIEESVTLKIFLTDLPFSLIEDLDVLKLVLKRTIEEDVNFSLEVYDKATLVLSFDKDVNLNKEDMKALVEKISKKQVGGIYLKPKLCPPSTCEQVTSAAQRKANKIQLSGIPAVDVDHLALWVERITRMENGVDFKVTMIGNSTAVLVVTRCLSDKGFAELIDNLQSKPIKGVYLKVKLTSGIGRILLSGIPSIEKDHLELLMQKILQMTSDVDFIITEFRAGKALISFRKDLSDADLGVMVEKLKNFKVKGSNIVVQKVDENWDFTKSTSSLIKLQLTNLPTVDSEFLGLVFGKATNLDHGDDFHIEMQADSASALMQITKPLSEEELKDVLKRIHGATVKGLHITATIFSEPQQKDNVVHTPKLLLEGVPDKIDEDYLKMVIANLIQLDDEMLEIEILECGAAILTLNGEVSIDGLEKMVTKIREKPIKNKTLKVSHWKDIPHLQVSNITLNYEEDYISCYFGNSKRSGGGEVVAVELLGNGEAVVKFKDLKAMKCVLNRSHTVLGPAVTLAQVNPLRKSVSASLPVSSFLQIEASNILIEAIKGNDSDLRHQVSGLYVDVSLDSQNGAITIQPTKRTPAGWSKQCEDIVRCYIKDTFAEIELPISKEAGTEVYSYLLNKKLEHTLSFAPVKDNTFIRIAGHSNVVKQVQEKVREIIASVATIEKVFSLSPEDFAYVSQIKKDNISGQFPEITITCDNAPYLSANGAAKHISLLEKQISSLAEHHCIALELKSSLEVEFLSSKVGHKVIIDFLQAECQKSVAIFVKEAGRGISGVICLLCHCNDKNSIEKAASKLQNNMYSEQIIVTQKQYTVLHEQEHHTNYSDLCQRLEQEHCIMIWVEKNGVNIAGLKNDVNKGLAAIKAFINSACTVKKTTKISLGVWRLLQSHMKVLWDTKYNHYTAQGVMITISKQANKEHVIIQLQGQVDIVDEAFELTLKITKAIISKDMQVSFYGIQKHVNSTQWKTNIAGIELIKRVCITTPNQNQPSESDAEFEIKESDHILPTKSHEMELVSDVPKLQCVRLCKGSLLDVKAEVYVNSTNATLDLSGGSISKLLAKAAGPSLQEECSHKAPIALGSVAITGGGKIACKHIFHVAISSYDGPGGCAEKDLEGSVRSCLNECKQKGISSIAFPCLGTGALNFPPQLAAEIIFNAIATFDDLPSDIDIKIVIFLDDVYEIFKNEKKRAEKQFYASSENRAVKPRSNTSALSALAKNKTVIGPVTIEVSQGDITDQNSDVIVNTTSSDMKATSGVSAAILKKGGPDLWKACEAYIKKNNELKEGIIACTSAFGSLKCRSIFHINVDPKKLEDSVYGCLMEAERCKYKSISFPALGTGNHKCSPEKVASEMAKAIKKFANSNNPQCIGCVNIVIYLREVYSSFSKAFQLLQPTFFSPSAVMDLNLDADVAIRGEDEDVSEADDQDSEDDNGAIQGEDEDVSEAHDQDSEDDNGAHCSESTVCLRIYGEREMNIIEAEVAINDYIKEHFISETINDVIIADPNELEEFSKHNHVHFEYNPTLHCIKLHGEKYSTATVCRKIEKEISLHSKKQSLKQTAELVQRQVVWQYQLADGSFSAYSCDLNYQIEQAFQAKESTFCHSNSSENFVIDFVTKIVLNNTNGSKAAVQRIDLLALSQEGEKPKTWEKMPTDPKTNVEVGYHLFDLQQNSSEYIEVAKLFSATASKHQIKKIQRVQNYVLYAQYIGRKKVMDKLNPANFKNEHRLFHGTSVVTCEKINSQGFNRSFAGLNATRYGKGVYFARNASYSASPTYSAPDSNGNKYMYLVRVLTGECTAGNDSMIVPPAKNPANPNILFDSVVDNTANPSMYIIFQDAQAYPEYLITFC